MTYNEYDFGGYHCKKCDFVTYTMSDIVHHSKTIHKKKANIGWLEA